MRNTWLVIGMVAFLAFVSLVTGAAFAQTTLEWRSDATTGNWSEATNWSGSQTPPGSEVLTFGNNAQLTMTNDAVNTTRHRIIFGAGASSTRTIGGSTANLFVAVGGDAPMIRNSSAGSHHLNFPIEVATDGLVFDTVTGPLNIGGMLSGAGTITKTGGGSGGISGNPQNVAITANNSGFTGRWVVTGGNLSINDDAALGAVPGAFVADALTLDGGSLANMTSASGTGFASGHSFTLHANRGITLGSGGGNIRIGYSTRTVTIEGAITGVGALSVSDNATLVLANPNNTYEGGTSVHGVTTLQIVADGSLGELPESFVANNVVLSGAVTLSNHSSFDVVINEDRGIQISSGSRLSSQGTGKSLTVESVISGSGGLNIASGTGTVILTGANTYTGGTTIVSGSRLAIGNGGANGSVLGDIANAGALIVNRSSTWTYSGAISGGGTLTKSGAGALELSGANTYTGRTTVTGGSLRIAADSGLGVAPATFVADQLTLNGGELMNLNSDTVIAATRGIVLGASGGRLRAGWSKSLEVASVISGAGELTIVSNSGTVILSGANTYTGATSIQSALKLQGGNNRLPVVTSITLSDSALAKLDLGGTNQTIRWLTGGGGSGGSVVNTGASTSTLTLNLGSSGNRTFAGTIDGNIRVAITGSSSKNSDVQIFSRTNSYTGGTVIDNGHLRVVNDSYLGAVPDDFDPDNIVLKNGGVLQNHDSNLALDANRGILLEQGNGVFYTGWNLDITVNGAISGPGRLVKADNGRLILAAANSHTGDTVFQHHASGPRAIVLRHQDALQYSTFDATIMGGTGASVLDLDGRNVVLGGLKGAGATISNFTGQLSVGNNHQDNVFAGVLSGSGSLVKIGNGTLTLAGDNPYTGGTIVDSGTLLVTGALSGTSGVQVTSGGTLGGTGSIGGATTIAADGTLAPGASIGTISFTEALSLEDNATLQWEFLATGTAGQQYGQYDTIQGTDLFLPESGTVNLRILGLDGYTLAAGDSFTLFHGNVYQGTTLLAEGTDISHLFNISDNIGWWGDWEVTAGSLVLTAVPEPATPLLLLSALVLLLGRRKRKLGAGS